MTPLFSPRFPGRLSTFSGLLLAAVAAASVARADSLNVPPAPAVGSLNVATADLLVAHPTTTPCVVTLLQNQEFADFNIKPISYTPPANCPGPWAKVVFAADLSVTPGVQYDRTGTLNLGGVNIFFGTTSEPQGTVGPSWHVERDVTDYSALFTSAQTGAASLGNIFNSTYTGDIFGTFTLAFYPTDANDPAPTTASQVLPLNGPDGASSLGSTSALMSQTFTLPTNIDAAYLDIIAQSQSSDEFWYTCVPDDLASELESCGSTGFREVEVSIDGQPAGVAPVSPWIYTGGISPALWIPIPGVQTLNFVPYRVNLTPFAALLSNGASHTVAVSVFNADNYFAATGTLLLYLDSGSTQVTGALTANTLTAAPTPVVDEGITTSGSDISGTVSVTSTRQFSISGYVNTSAGKVTTSVSQIVNFSNAQQFDIALLYKQNIDVTTTVSTTTTTTNAKGTAITDTFDWGFPLKLDYSSAHVSASQTYTSVLEHKVAGLPVAVVRTRNQITPSYELITEGSSQKYSYLTTAGDCYARTITAKKLAVSAVTTGCDSSSDAAKPGAGR